MVTLRLHHAVTMSSPASSANASNDPSLQWHNNDILNVAIFLSYKA